jgi:hypothetical protein
MASLWWQWARCAPSALLLFILGFVPRLSGPLTTVVRRAFGLDDTHGHRAGS